LIASLAAFIWDRPYFATILSAVAVVMHSTYLLPAALLTIAYVAASWRDMGWKRAGALAGLSVLLFTPPIIHVASNFLPTSDEPFAEAQAVIAHFRIPHHAEPERWFDDIAVFQLFWVLLATWLVRNSRLALLLLIPFVLGACLSLVQYVSGSDTLALLFPWRISVILVPIATAVILSKLALLISTVVNDGPRYGYVCVTAILAALVGGMLIMASGLGFRTIYE